jgi:hypothetical protein
MNTAGNLDTYNGTGSAYNNGIYGVLAGWEYLDANSKPVKANYLPASQTGITQVYAYVYTDPDIVYEIGCDASLTAAAVGDQLTTITLAGNATTGYGTCYSTGALAGANAQGVLRVIDIALQPDNDWGDAKTVAQVEICGLQTVAVKVAI